MKYYLLLILSVLIASCTNPPEQPVFGFWKAEMVVQDEEVLPFTLEYKTDNTMVVYNAEERVELTDITFKEDSIFIHHPIFEGTFKGVYSKDKISGIFIKPSIDRITPFTMTAGKEVRFKSEQPANYNIEGVWEMTFDPNVPDKSSPGRGVFKSDGNKVTGNIQTLTGDYRYLEGVVSGSELKLSTFDGAHAFLFKAKVTDSTMNGVFYSETHWREPFVAKRNTDFQLADSSSLTYLKDGYERLEFAFPMDNGDTLTLSDPIFKNKVAVIQIMGTWCPNCLDESKYLAQYARENQNPDIQIAALAFEYAKTTELAFAGIKRLKDRLGIAYPIALAQVGSDSKTEANKKLPMLNHILSFPTTIIIDKSGKVRKIHTGFNGPATGEAFAKFKTEFEGLLAELAAE